MPENAHEPVRFIAGGDMGPDRRAGILEPITDFDPAFGLVGGGFTYGDGQHPLMVDGDGEVIDEYPRTPGDGD
jgi:hypothetical protein